MRPWYRQDWLILVGLWLAVAIADGLWLLTDQSPPAWDQGEHLARALNFWRVLQQPEWLNPDWWTTLWRQSPGYRAPWFTWLPCRFSTFWLTIITNSQSSNANWIPSELVPDSISSVLSYYARMLPRLVTYTLLIAGILGGVAGVRQYCRAPLPPPVA